MKELFSYVYTDVYRCVHFVFLNYYYFLSFFKVDVLYGNEINIGSLPKSSLINFALLDYCFLFNLLLIFLLQVNLGDEFDILQIVGEGWFGKILLVEHKATDTEMVLKALPKPYTSLKDFYREFHYGLHLSAHKNIITTYDVSFETAGFYVFSQEYAPLGKLRKII